VPDITAADAPPAAHVTGRYHSVACNDGAMRELAVGAASAAWRTHHADTADFGRRA